VCAAQVVRLLEARPELEYLWYDAWCLPQANHALACAECDAKTEHRGECAKNDRTPEERAYFGRVLGGGLQWLNLRAVFVPLWGEPQTDYIHRAWCFAELVWGHDRQLIVKGLNEPDAALQREIDLQYGRLVGSAVYVLGACARRPVCCGSVLWAVA